MVEAFGWIRGEKVVTKVGTEHVWPDAVTENSNFAKNFSRPAWIVPHLPDFFLAGWRFPITLFCLLFLQCFSLLMILQHAWTIVRPTLNAASLVVMASSDRNGRNRRSTASWPFPSSGSGTEGAVRTRTFKEGVSE